MVEEWIYNDGGRAEFGSVASAGDCACRAIAIAGGFAYADVYEALTELNGMTPRNGTFDLASTEYLKRQGWSEHRFERTTPVALQDLPPGRLIVRLDGHLSAVIDRTIHDTYDPRHGGRLMLEGYYWHPRDAATAGHLRPSEGQSVQAPSGERVTDRVKQRIRQLLKVAENRAATEAEVRNALRFAQNLMRKHSIEREDLGDDDDVSRVRYARAHVFFNGVRRTRWELDLARFIATDLCPSCGYYTSDRRDDARGKKAACVFFYGPEEDVSFCVDLFLEMILSIAASAKLKGYGGFARGDGAQYCTGFVDGLSEAFHRNEYDLAQTAEGRELIATSRRRSVTLAEGAARWLSESEGVRLVSRSGLSGGYGSAQAYRSGLRDGMQTSVTKKQLRITQK